MGTIIKSSAVSLGQDGIGSPDLMMRAAQECLDKAGVEKKDVDLLVNVGIYRNENIVEPAMAALVQQKLDLNVHPHAHLQEEGHRTFSFDLMNGSCGFLNAVQVIDALITCGKASHALVVSGDIHPSKESTTAEFPFTHLGAAVLLAESEVAEQGFEHFEFKTSEKSHVGLQGSVDLGALGGNGRDHIEIALQDGYYQQLRTFAAEKLSRYVRSYLPDDARLRLITSQPQRGFGMSLAREAGLDADAVIDSYGRYGNSHTAALSIGFHVGIEEDRIKEHDRLVFLDVGSGLTSALVLYNM